MTDKLASPLPPKLVLIAGLAGSGYSTALNVLEDVGFSSIDNLPFAMINQIISLEVETGGRNLAVSVDGRTSGFDAHGLAALMDDIRHRLGDEVKLVFLTASEVELARRFNATRRHHPLGNHSGDTGEGLPEAIKKDSEMMQSIADIADIIIDTSGTSPTHFRSSLLSQLNLIEGQKLPIFVSSFSYRNGVPENADMVMDMRFLENPHWAPDLAPLTGKDAPVQDFIMKSPEFEKFITSLETMIKMMLPRFNEEGRPQFNIAFGCTGGRHRSVFAAEATAQFIRAMGHHVQVHHKVLNR